MVSNVPVHKSFDDRIPGNPSLISSKSKTVQNFSKPIPFYPKLKVVNILMYISLLFHGTFAPQTRISAVRFEGLRLFAKKLKNFFGREVWFDGLSD